MSDYLKAQERYQALAKAAANGDQQAFKDKAKAMNEIRGIEREAARAGTVLSARRVGDKIVVDQQEGRSKRSQQEEYIDKFDGEVTAMLPDLSSGGGDPKKRELKEQTLREYHRKRLLKK